MKKEHYTPPRVQKKVRILLERNFLGTISPQTNAQTSGQEVVEYDFSQETDVFNHRWTSGTE